MREILQTHDLSLALSSRIALDAAAIPYSANYGDGMEPTRSPMQLFVLNDADYDAARRIVSSLQVSPMTVTPGSGSKRFLWFCIVVGLLMVIFIALIPKIVAR